MELASPEPVDHDVNFMIGAEGRGAAWRSGGTRGPLVAWHEPTPAWESPPWQPRHDGAEGAIPPRNLSGTRDRVGRALWSGATVRPAGRDRGGGRDPTSSALRSAHDHDR